MSETQTAEVQGTLVLPDFSGVQDSVEPGIYKCRIVSATVDQWAGKDGKPPTVYINWRMETFAETEAKNNGRSIFHKTPINGGGAFRLKDFYKAAMGEECTGQFDMTMLYGKELEVTVAPQKNAPEYNEVKTVKAITH